MRRVEENPHDAGAGRVSLDALEAEVARHGSESLATLVWLAKLAREVTRGESVLGQDVLGLPRLVGQFRLQSLLGTGAYGAVFRAVDQQLGRDVAVKLAWPGVLLDPAGSQRFANEPRAMAQVKHRGIAEVYEAGEIDMIGYIAMELIDGPTLAAWSAERLVSADVAAAIVAAVAQAIEFAHRRGVVHRDLKPTNILLREGGCAEGRHVEPVVTDFGLATRAGLLSNSVATATCAVLGTDHYMSPEQAAGRSSEVGPASDVFSLGVMLYELLSGTRPFQGESSEEVRRRIQHEQHEPLGKSQRPIPRPVEAIVDQCLEKSPADRYDSAQALAADLRRYLHKQPVAARQQPAWRRGWSRLRRDPRRASLLTLALISIVIMAAISLGWARDRRDKAHELSSIQAVARAATRGREERDYAAGIQAAAAFIRRGNRREALESLTQCERLIHTGPGVEWHWLRELASDQAEHLPAHRNAVHTVRFAPAGDQFVSAGRDGRVALWQTSPCRMVWEYDPRSGEINAAEFSSTGEYVAIASDDGRARVYRVDDHSIAYEEKLFAGRALDLAWLGDTSRLALVGDGDELVVVDLNHGEIQRTSIEGATGIQAITFLPQRQAIAIHAAKLGVFVLDADSLGVKARLTAEWAKAVGAITCTSRELEQLVVYDRSGVIRFLDTSNFTEASQIRPSTIINAMRFSAAHGVLLTGAYLSGLFEVFDCVGPAALRPVLIRQLPGDGGRVMCLDVAANGTWLASGDRDGMIHLRQARSLGTLYDVPLDHVPWSIQFSPDGKWLAVSEGGVPGQVRLLAVNSLEPRWSRGDLDAAAREVPGANIAFNPSGELLIAWSSEHQFQTLDALTGNVRQTYSLPLPPEREAPRHLQFSPDGSFIVAHVGNIVDVFDARSGQPTARRDFDGNSFLGIHRCCLGDVWTEWDRSGSVLMRRSLDGPVIRALPGLSVGIKVVAISPDGQSLACGGYDGAPRIFRLDSDMPPVQFLGGAGFIHALGFSPDGRTLLSLGSSDSALRLWHVATGAELMHEGGEGKPIVSCAIDRSGQLMVLGVGQGSRGYGLQVHRFADNGGLKPLSGPQAADLSRKPATTAAN